jgi:HemY protein
MIRIILFLALIAAAAAGAAWMADQPGDVVLSWGGWRAETALPVFMLALGIVIVRAQRSGRSCAAVARRSASAAAGTNAATPAAATPSRRACARPWRCAAARRHADDARRHAGHDPLAFC